MTRLMFKDFLSDALIVLLNAVPCSKPFNFNGKKLRLNLYGLRRIYEGKELWGESNDSISEIKSFQVLAFPNVSPLYY